MNNHHRAEDSLAYKRRRYTAKLHPEVVQDLYERVNDGAIDVNLAMLLADVLGPGDWRQDAACRDTDPKVFFPEGRGFPQHAARKICDGCPVREECFTYAQEAPETDGFWAGFSAGNRRRAASDRRQHRSKFATPALICVDCFTDLDEPHTGTPVCGACRDKRRTSRNASQMQQRGSSTYWAASA